MILTRFAIFASLLVSAAGCIVEHSDSPPPLTDYPERPAPVPLPTPIKPSVEPLVVVIDTNEAMKVVGGEGVGIYVEYDEGGKWRVRLTCDSNKSGLSCKNKLRIGSAGGRMLSYLDDVGTKTKAASFDANVTSKLDIPEIAFESEPGESVTISADIDGVAAGDGQFFFFVQDKKVNGGFEGKLTNPLTFKPARP
jgi:hypothetical protein